ncbi:hypothetical protein AYM40_37480 (plasmid) [Paraburkholderia phytofirmans OLGA172]|uniref:Uncharacterized protein n=1 Tax=Paraburkholderia phytofirmans OLGA172 TaxID=1417228 RepID=A0A167WQX7_9BURK|nr:hypothetical protein [Paraburkholderia phytofirmans]ANB78055.1 hypothetical protein AYM40_37480 [Paraburkholderia phytofirmans OLGA172]
MSIYKVPGCNGEIHVSTLPSGDLTVKAHGDRAAIDVACAVAGRHFGTWNTQHENWIVPRRNSILLTNDLTICCKAVC